MDLRYKYFFFKGHPCEPSNDKEGENIYMNIAPLISSGSVVTGFELGFKSW